MSPSDPLVDIGRAFLLPPCGKIPQRCFTQAFTITFALGLWATLDHLWAS